MSTWVGGNESGARVGVTDGVLCMEVCMSRVSIVRQGCVLALGVGFGVGLDTLGVFWGSVDGGRDYGYDVMDGMG